MVINQIIEIFKKEVKIQVCSIKKEQVLAILPIFLTTIKLFSIIQKPKTMYQLAQINIARMRGETINDPIMKEFVDNLEEVNQLAENSDGFIWRLKDDSDSAVHFNPYNDEKIIINVSVWKDVDSLKDYTYKSYHSEFLKRRKEWFMKFAKAHYALWWIEENQFPTIEECVERLDCLQKNGDSEKAFTFKRIFPSPQH